MSGRDGLSRGKGKMVSTHLVPQRAIHAATLRNSPGCAVHGGVMSLAPDLLTRVSCVGEFFTNLHNLEHVLHVSGV